MEKEIQSIAERVKDEIVQSMREFNRVSRLIHNSLSQEAHQNDRRKWSVERVKVIERCEETIVRSFGEMEDVLDQIIYNE